MALNNKEIKVKHLGFKSLGFMRKLLCLEIFLVQAYFQAYNSHVYKTLQIINSKMSVFADH